MSTRCPKCEFSSWWNGERCGHCKFVSATRSVGVVAGAGAAVLSLGSQAQAATASAALTAPPSAPAPTPAADVGTGVADSATGGDNIVDAIGEFFGEVFKGLLGG